MHGREKYAQNIANYWTLYHFDLIVYFKLGIIPALPLKLKVSGANRKDKMMATGGKVLCMTCCAHVQQVCERMCPRERESFRFLASVFDKYRCERGSREGAGRAAATATSQREQMCDSAVISGKVGRIPKQSEKMLAARDAALCLMLLLLGSREAAAAKNITATGGGVVKAGDDLVLTYNVGSVWDRCYWFWYVF